MSQRQVLQGRLGRGPGPGPGERGWRGARPPADPAPRRCRPQCSSSTSAPGCSSRRRWPTSPPGRRASTLSEVQVCGSRRGRAVRGRGVLRAPGWGHGQRRAPRPFPGFCFISLLPRWPLSFRRFFPSRIWPPLCLPSPPRCGGKVNCAARLRAGACAGVGVSGWGLQFISRNISQNYPFSNLLPPGSDVALCKVQRLEFPMKPALICQGNSTFRINKFLYRLYKLFLNSSMLSAGRLARFRRDLILLYCCHGMSWTKLNIFRKRSCGSTSTSCCTAGIWQIHSARPKFLGLKEEKEVPGNWLPEWQFENVL